MIMAKGRSRETLCRGWEENKEYVGMKVCGPGIAGEEQQASSSEQGVGLSVGDHVLRSGWAENLAACLFSECSSTAKGLEDPDVLQLLLFLNENFIKILENHMHHLGSKQKGLEDKIRLTSLNTI